MKRFLAGLVFLCWTLTAGLAAADCDPVGSVPLGTVVYHGSPVGAFTWRDPALNPAPPFAHPAAPDGPAWFASTWEFAIHAGARFLLGQVDVENNLFRYRTTQQLAVLSCSDHAAFTAETGITFDDGDYPAAVTFCAGPARHQYNGYAILADAVRAEPELILCAPATVLELTGQETWLVTQVDGGTFTGSVGKPFTAESYACLLNNGDLVDFRCAVAPDDVSGVERLESLAPCE